MKARFAVGPKIAHRTHHEGKQWRYELLQIVADKKVYLPRLADYWRRIDRGATMKDRVDMQHRTIVQPRVVTGMTAKRTFRPSLVRRRMSNKRKLGFRRKSMAIARSCLRHLQLLSAEQRRQNKFRNVFGQWRDCREH